MPGAHATAGHPLHVERITLREIPLPLKEPFRISWRGRSSGRRTGDVPTECSDAHVTVRIIKS